MATTVEKASKALQEALKGRYEQSRSIKREGTQVVIPERMSIEDAINLLVSLQKSMDETTERTFHMTCHPHDGLIAFYDACTEAFGAVLGDKSYGFWGEVIPSQTASIPVGYNQTRDVPYGAIKIPGLPVTFDVNPKFNSAVPFEGELYVTAKYKRLFEPIVDDVEKATRQWLKDKSIYLHQAIDSQFQFLNIDTDPLVVYSGDEEKFLESHLFNVIKHTARVKKSGIPIKRTLLLTGQYGTGKTLTALKAAKMCVANGWTFMNVKTGDPIVNALRFGQTKQPCLIFFEDVDTALSGDRTVDVNTVLNEIDGILSKSAAVVTVLTTNHVDLINRAMLRPGRVTLFELGRLDPDTIKRLVVAYGGDMLDGDLDAEALGKAAFGYTSAFVATAVNTAKSYAIVGDAEMDTKHIRITQQNVVDALVGLRPQFDTMMSAQRVETPTIDKAINENVTRALQPVMEKLESM